MSGEVWVNDVDLGDYDFVLGPGTKGHADAPEITDPTVDTQGWPGSLWAGEPARGAVRTIDVGGFITATTNAAFLAALDHLKALCEDGAVRIRFGDRPTQEYRQARCKRFPDARKGSILFGTASDLAISFQTPLPQRFDVNPLGYALSTARTSCAMGTAPSLPVFILSTGGSATPVVNPIITIRNAAGDSVMTMGFTGSIAQNDFWRVDSARAQVTKSIAGTASDGISLWTAGDFPVLRPADGWFELSAWPTVELSATSGTPVGEITYTRQYV